MYAPSRFGIRGLFESSRNSLPIKGVSMNTIAPIQVFANFFTEVPKVAKKFKYSMTYSVFMIVVIIIMANATFIPWSWNINIFIAIFPVAMLCTCHLPVPIALNPGLMTFYW